MEENYIFFDLKEAFTEQDIVFILTLCDELLPPPISSSVTQTKGTIERTITSYLDRETLKAFRRNKYGIEYDSGMEKPGIRISKIDGGGLISIPLVNKDEYHLTKKIALRLVEGMVLKGMSVAPVKFTEFKQQYKANRRTVDYPGLYWLQFYGAEEFKKQGGTVILDNPYIDAMLIKDGIFIQVGESPYEVHTPEGKERMIKANKAMPPVIKDDNQS